MKLKSLKYLLLMIIFTLAVSESYSYHILDFSGDEIHLEIELETEVENEVEIEAALEKLTLMSHTEILLNGYSSVSNLETLYIGVNHPPPEFR